MWPAPGFVRRAGRSLVFFSKELRIKFLLVWVDLSRSAVWSIVLIGTALAMSIESFTVMG